MKILLALILGITIFVASATPVPWQNCGNAYDLVRITKLEMIPFPPQSNQDLAIAVQGYTSRNITGGTVRATVTVDGFTIQLPPKDLCSLMHGLCPIRAGPFRYNSTVALPQVGSASLTVQANVTNQAGDGLVCAEIDTKIELPPAGAPVTTRGTVVARRK